MMFTILQYATILCFLVFCLVEIFKKYLNPLTSRNDDYYIIMALLGIFLNYFVQFIVLATPYSVGLVFFAHACKIFGFWGFSSFVVNQMYFKNLRLFRIHKVIITFFYFSIVAICASILIEGPNIIPIVPKYILVSLTSNLIVDIIFDLTCLFTTIFMSVSAYKVKIGPKLFLFSGVWSAFACYILFLTNLIFFAGMNITIFTTANILGIVASLLIVFVISDYILKAKKHGK